MGAGSHLARSRSLLGWFEVCAHIWPLTLSSDMGLKRGPSFLSMVQKGVYISIYRHTYICLFISLRMHIPCMLEKHPPAKLSREPLAICSLLEACCCSFEKLPAERCWACHFASLPWLSDCGQGDSQRFKQSKSRGFGAFADVTYIHVVLL